VRRRVGDMWRGLEGTEETRGAKGAVGPDTQPTNVGGRKLKLRENRGGWQENKWELLKCRVMVCDEERKAVHSIRREAQQVMKCWGCGKAGHCLWTDFS